MGEADSSRLIPSRMTGWFHLAVRAVSALAVLALVLAPAFSQDRNGVDESASTGQAGEASGAVTPLIPAWRQASNVAIITIEGDIDNVTVASVERRLKEAELAGADAVVFEIDTFGGLAAAALEICEIIKGSTFTKTTAWVNPKAYSAGTFIALACNEIVISQNATIGDCAPILPGLIPVPAAERAKIESPLLEEVVDSARRNGYDEKLVMSFVAVEIELWLVRHREDGHYRFIDRSEYTILFGEDPPDDARMSASGSVPVGSQTTPGNEGNDAIRRFLGPSGRITQDELDETSSNSPIEERMAEAQRQQALPDVAQPITAADGGQFDLIEPVINERQLLVLKEARALRYGLAKKTIDSDQELQQFFGATTLTRYQRTWSEGLVRLLTSMPVRIGLVLIFAIGLIWELSAPGVSAPGAVAAVALLILLGAPALTGLAQWWDILFVLLGIFLIIVELFVIPGFGIAGIAGVVLLGVGFIGTFIAPDPGGGLLPSSPEAQQAALRGALTALVALFGGGIGLYFISKHFQSLPFFNKLVLATTSADDSQPASMYEPMRPMSSGRPRTGDVGVVETQLRPSGKARFGDQLYDVVSGRGIIDAGTTVVVRESDAFSIAVEPATRPNDNDDGSHDSNAAP